MRKMKDSGIPWIGEIPKDWEVGRIAQLYSERKEKVSDIDYPPLSVTMKGIVPQLSTAAKTDAHDDRKLVRKGDFTINSRSDRRGSCGISQYDGSVSLINTILAPRGEMNPVYYDWLFHSTMFSDEFYKWGHGIVDDLWTTNWQDMKRISIPVPSVQEQKRIADHLDTECARIDAVMEQTRASIEEYKKLKQSIITEAVTKGIHPNRPMKDSGIDWIGTIPKEWKVRPLKNIISLIESGVSVNAAQHAANEAEIGVLKTSCVSKFVFIPSENKAVDADELARVSCPVKANTLIVSRMNTPDLVGACGYVEKDYVNLFLPDRLWQVHFSDGISVKYIWYYMNNRQIRSYYGSLAVGTSSSMQNISQDQFYNTLALMPDREEQNEIVCYLDRYIGEIDSAIRHKENLCSEMEAYKKSLIFEYVTGKKEV